MEEEEEEDRTPRGGFNHGAAKDAEARSPLLLSFTANAHLCSSFMKWTSLLTSPLGVADKRASTFMTKSLALEVGNNNGVLMHSEDAQRASQSVKVRPARPCRHYCTNFASQHFFTVLKRQL